MVYYNRNIRVILKYKVHEAMIRPAQYGSEYQTLEINNKRKIATAEMRICGVSKQDNICKIAQRISQSILITVMHSGRLRLFGRIQNNVVDFITNLMVPSIRQGTNRLKERYNDVKVSMQIIRHPTWIASHVSDTEGVRIKEGTPIIEPQ